MINLILRHGDDACQLLLACGHWSHPVSVMSSVFDFPMDEEQCPVCVDLRYLDPRLQVELLRALGTLE